MKKVIVGLMMIASAFQANATSLMPVLMSSPLAGFYFEPGTVLAQSNIRSGYVAVAGSDIYLTMQPELVCPKGNVCPEIMPAPIQIKVELISVRNGSCGEVVYAGLTDQRPVDGGLTEIQVVDNSRNTCETLVLQPRVVVSLTMGELRSGFVQHHTLTSTPYLR